ncbi:MAG: hypothetical protein AAF649_10405 [Verrucomicrobiota bacterium]
MKRSSLTLSFLYLTALLLLPALVSADIIVFKNNKRSFGTVKSLKDGIVHFSLKTDAGEANSKFPLKTIREIEFYKTEEQRKVLFSGDAADLDSLRDLWLMRKPFLAIKGSDSGEVGIIYIKRLLDTNEPENVQQAMQLCQLLLDKDWSEDRYIDVRALEVYALSKAGKTQEAAEALAAFDEEFEAGLASSDETAKVRLVINAIQANLAWDKILQLEKDWPKWHLMPEMRHERQQLINRALDGNLTAVAFYPKNIKECSQGLWNAVKIYQHIGRHDLAVKRAQTIIDFFPHEEFLAGAQKLIQQENH